MAPTNDEFHCYVCDAAVSEREVLDGWCDNCGKKLPASFKETVKRRLKKPAPAPVSLDLTDSPPASLKRRLVVGGVVLGVLGGLALVFVLAGGG
jgi:hypothetical protein